MRRYGIALLATGVAWALFHLPVLVLLSRKTGHARPVAAVAVQLANLTVAGFIVRCSSYSIAAAAAASAAATVVCEQVPCAIPHPKCGWDQIGSATIWAGYSVWPAAFMHWIWNRVNPVVCGSIYTNSPGACEVTLCGK